MFRVCHVLVTVLGMVLCPFACAGELHRTSAPTQNADLRQAPSCSCCQHRAAEQEESPTGGDGPDSQSGCGCTCLCKGALKGDPGLSNVVTDVPHVAIAPIVDLDDSSCTEASVWWLLGGPPASYPSGRLARLVHQSLLC